MKKIIIISTFSILVGCSAIGLEEPEIIERITQPDYVSSSKAKRLEIPPDLSEIEGSTTFSVPGEATSYKDYKEQQNSKPDVVKLIDKPDGMKIVKSGALRWLIVNKDAETLWPHIEAFWEDMGFGVKLTNKRTGVMETEWIKTSELVNKNSGALSRFDAWLDSMSGFADRRKFRTRVEPGQEPGTTEIYLSQRSATSGTAEHERILNERKATGGYGTEIYKIEEYKSDDKKVKNIDMTDKRNLDDYEIDSELLTRLMIKLGSSDLDAKHKVNNPVVQDRAEFITQENESYIKLFDPFDRSWRRLSLALDIIGFVTEDKNRSDGILYVKYKNLELPSGPTKKDEGILDSLAFWRDDESDTDQKGKEGSKEAKDQSSENEDDSSDKKSWTNLLNWGEADEKDKGVRLDMDEVRYRIRILPLESGAKVYIDYPDEKKNNTPEAQKILKIIYEHLK
jgi:outer membrane protein assembly factor BamC